MAQFEFDSEEWQWTMRMDLLKTNFRELEKITDKWGFYRQIYMEMLPYIIERAKKDIVTPIIPYAIDWQFSPIEELAWSSIRSHYMALYPQFPLFNYFVDFANPYLRIGVELDGKDYHDSVKDRERDEMLLKYGWRIYRIPGSECFTQYKSRDLIQEMEHEWGDKEGADEEYRKWILNSSDGFFYALKVICFLKDYGHDHYSLCMQTLDRHRGANFEIY